MSLTKQIEGKNPFKALEALEELSGDELRAAVPVMLARLKRVDLEKNGEGFLAVALLNALQDAAPANETTHAALFDLADSSALPDCRDDAQLESAAIAAVRRLKPKRGVLWLEARFRDEAWGFWASEIAEALTELGGASTAPAFVEGLGRAPNDDYEYDVVIAAALALGRLRHQAAAPALEQLANSPDGEVRAAAQTALLSMFPERAVRQTLDAIAGLRGTSAVGEWEQVATWMVDFRVVEAVDPLLAKVEAVAGAEHFDWFERAAWRACHRIAAERMRPVFQRAYADEARSPWTRLSAGLHVLKPGAEALAVAVIELARQADGVRSGGSASSVELPR